MQDRTFNRSRQKGAAAKAKPSAQPANGVQQQHTAAGGDAAMQQPKCVRLLHPMLG